MDFYMVMYMLSITIRSAVEPQRPSACIRARRFRPTKRRKPTQKTWPRAWTPRPSPPSPTPRSSELSRTHHCSPLVSLSPPSPPPRQPHTSIDRTRDTRRHGRAAHHRRARPPAPGLLLRLHLHHPVQELQTTAPTATFFFPSSAVAEGRGAGGGRAPACGAPASGRAGGRGAARDPGGPDVRAGAPGGHGRPLRLHALGRLPRLAVAPRPHHPGRDHRAQEAGQAGRRGHPRRGRRRRLRSRATAARRQVAGRDQDRRAHRGEEEAAQGLVPGPALQRGLHPARARRPRVRRRRGQHLHPHGQALPGPAPLRRRRHHRALGGRGGARPGDAEGERDRQEPPHRAQRRQRPALHLADPHRARDRRKGLRVHHMAVSTQTIQFS